MSKLFLSNTFPIDRIIHLKMFALLLLNINKNNCKWVQVKSPRFQIYETVLDIPYSVAQKKNTIINSLS